MSDVIERTTVSLPRELIARLRVMAIERHTSMAAIIREALEEKAARARPKPKSIGMGESQYTDTGERLANERQPPRSWR
jgi:predicted transcriptional regulator